MIVLIVSLLQQGCIVQILNNYYIYIEREATDQRFPSCQTFWVHFYLAILGTKYEHTFPYNLSLSFHLKCRPWIRSCGLKRLNFKHFQPSHLLLQIKTTTFYPSPITWRSLGLTYNKFDCKHNKSFIKKIVVQIMIYTHN